MRFGSDRRQSEGHLVAALVAIVALGAACTSAQIEPPDASGQAGASGTGGGASGAGGRAGASGAGGQAGITGAAGDGHGGATAGAAGTEAAGSGGATAGAGGTGGAAAGAGGAAAGTGHGGAGSGGAGGRAGGQGGSAGSVAGAGGAAGATAGTGGAAAGAGGGAGASAGASGNGGGAAGSGGAAGATAGAGGSAGAGGAAVMPTLAGQIVITELMHDTDVVGDDFGEWFEVYNPDANLTYDLFGCQIKDAANMDPIAGHLLVPPHAFRTLALFSTGGGFTPDYTYTGIKFDNNGPDEVNIVCGSTLIDKLAYSASLASVSGHAFSVDPAHYSAIDNDNPANYCLATTVYNMAPSGSTVVRDYGTPGMANPPCPH